VQKGVKSKHVGDQQGRGEGEERDGREEQMGGREKVGRRGRETDGREGA